MKERHYFQWHIIHRCNLHCSHCYQEDYDAVMQYDEMCRVLDSYEEFINARGYEGQINLTGGEPLLHPSFWEFARNIRSRKMRLGVLTNGTLITNETAKKLADLHPVFVQVSLDGSKKIHDDIRGSGAFDRTIEGIDFLKHNGVRVLVSFTAMKGNVSSFKKLARECNKHRVDKLWWDRVVTDDPAVYLTTNEFKHLSKVSHKLKRKYPFVSNNRSLQWIPDGQCSYQCNAGKNLLILLANGDLMACRRLPFIIGNVRDSDSLSSIIRKSDIMKVLARPVFPDKCKTCVHLMRCQAGGRCITYAQTGKLDICDVNCYI